MSLLTQWSDIKDKITKAMKKSQMIIDHSNPYDELQYLTMSGTQWINPSITVTSSYIVEIKYLITGSSSGMGRLLGTPSDQNFEIAASGTTAVRWGINGSGSTTSISSGVAHTYLAYGNGKLYIDGTLKLNRNANQSSKTLYLFNGYDSQKVKGSFYYCKIWNGTTLIRDFIPVINNDNNIVCLYDRVNDVFYYNRGTGSFVAGPAK